MIHILIVLWFGYGSSYAGKAAVAVEFNDKASCLAAAEEIRKQAARTHEIGAILCAAKGKP